MDFDWKVVRSSFLGRTIANIAWLLFVALATFFGFAPEETIRAMTPSNFPEASLLAARLIFLFFGAAAIALLIQQMRDIHWPSLYVPLGFAAVRAYEQARETQPVLARAAERMGGRNIGHAAEDDIVNYFAGWVGRKIEVYGVRPPATKRESFTFSSGVFKGRGAEYWGDYSNWATYKIVEVKRSDLRKLLSDMRLRKRGFDFGE